MATQKASTFARWLSKDHITASPGFNRWFVPPAALLIHLSIGQAYAFSVFKLPLTRVVGGTMPSPEDWTQPQLAWIFTIAIVFLGLSAATFGHWLESAGPRKSGLSAALCWSSGFAIAALGVHLHQIALLYVGYGVIGGCGLGLGYITPVSTLVRWFPDRRGLATGLAIMGFGGGAMIASPLTQMLLEFYGSGTPGMMQTAVIKTLLTFSLLYFCTMTLGALAFRVPPKDWRPEGWNPSETKSVASMVTSLNVEVSRAVRLPVFYLLWGILFVNVTAGIGILEQASPMIQELFRGQITASAAAGFVGLLSLFNMAGRFGWSSLSDVIGRRATYAVFFFLGPILYACIPWTAGLPSVPLFVVLCALILTMYGGGFATIPAYLADVFGTLHVGAIHGRLLTAWSCAGVAGPALVNYIREYQLSNGVPAEQAYNRTMYVMASLLVVGFFLNAAVRPVRTLNGSNEKK